MTAALTLAQVAARDDAQALERCAILQEWLHERSERGQCPLGESCQNQ